MLNLAKLSPNVGANLVCYTGCCEISIRKHQRMHLTKSLAESHCLHVAFFSSLTSPRLSVTSRVACSHKPELLWPAGSVGQREICCPRCQALSCPDLAFSIRVPFCAHASYNASHRIEESPLPFQGRLLGRFSSHSIFLFPFCHSVPGPKENDLEQRTTQNK